MLVGWLIPSLARTLVRRYAIGDILNDLAERMAAVAEVAAAGVSLAEGDRLRFTTGVIRRPSTWRRSRSSFRTGRAWNRSIAARS